MNAFNSDSLQIVLLRPGATDLDDQGRITGSLDVPLSANGKQQILQCSQDIAQFTAERIYSAPGLAAEQTVQNLSQFKNTKVRAEENLRNMNHGLWHGKRIDELKENQPKLFKQWQENPDLVHPPGGETVGEANLRIDRMLKQIKKRHKTGTVIIVAAEPLAGLLLTKLTKSDLKDHWQTDGRYAECTWVRCKDGEPAAT